MKHLLTKTPCASLGRLINPLRRDEHGNMIIITAVAIPVLLIAAGLAVDLNRYMNASSYVQAAVDQAAIAAVAVDGQDREEVAERFFNAALTDEVKENVELNNLNVREVFPEGGSLNVIVQANVKLTNKFGSFVGYQSVNIAKQGRATRHVEKVEAVITMASGGTMCGVKNRIPNPEATVPGDTIITLDRDENCTNFKAVKRGIRDFITILEDNETVSTFKVGVVPYNFKVKMPNTNMIPPSLKANEPDGFYQNVNDAEPLAKIVPLSTNIGAVWDEVARMNQTPDGIAWSRSDLASHVAGLMLDPSQSTYFPGGARPDPFGTAGTRKIMIMMTDGANTGCCYTNWPIGNYENQYVYSYQPYNQEQLKICDALKEQGVEIFTILFDVAETDAGGKEINNTFARCASGAYLESGVKESNSSAMLKCSEKANCFNAPDDKELVEIYRQIAQTFYKPVITK